MSELKPCPFCENDDWYFEQGTEGETEIVCDRCEYRSQTFQTIEDAIKWWETRPIEDGLRKRIAELEGENKKAFDFVKTLRTYCIYAHWDNPDTEGEFNEFDAEICKWLSEFTEREE